MKLIGSLTSPFVRKVRVVLAEKKIECEFEIDSPLDAGVECSHDQSCSARSRCWRWTTRPYFDSRVISEEPAYRRRTTSDARPQPRAHGSEALGSVGRWHSRRGCINLPGNEAPGGTAERRLDRPPGIKITRGLEYTWPKNPVRARCMGNHLTLADIATGCAPVSGVSLPGNRLAWHAPEPARLYDKLMQRPAFAESVPKG